MKERVEKTKEECGQLRAIAIVNPSVTGTTQASSHNARKPNLRVSPRAHGPHKEFFGTYVPHFFFGMSRIFFPMLGVYQPQVAALSLHDQRSQRDHEKLGFEFYRTRWFMPY